MISGAAEAFFGFSFLTTSSSSRELDREFLTKLGLTISEGGNIKEKQRLKCACFFDIREKIKSANSKKEMKNL